MTRALVPLPPPQQRFPAHPAHLDPFIEELGPALAVEFFRHFGGCTIHFAATPRGRSRAEQLIGADLLQRLGARLQGGKCRVPQPRHWMAHALREAYGMSVPEIVQELRSTEVSIRRLLRTAPTNRIAQPDDDDPRVERDGQMRLF